MEVATLVVAVATVVVAGLAAWWSRQAAGGTELAAARTEQAIELRWACEQAGSSGPQARAAGVAALTVLVDRNDVTEAQTRLIRTVARIYGRDRAAYAQHQENAARPGVGRQVVMTVEITQADIDLAKIYLRLSRRLGEPVEPEFEALARARPTAEEPGLLATGVSDPAQR